MSKILVVFGATGHQGSSIVNYVLNDSELSREYQIRAITRNINSEKIKQLKERVEVVQGDVLDRASLEAALTGAHTVFSMTTPDFGPNGLEVEYENGKRIADVAVEKGVEYIIFSTLPSASEITGGKYTRITPFEAKAKIEKYIRGLPIKSAFYCPGYFMEDFQSPIFLNTKKAPDGTWVITRNVPSTALMPIVDAVGDSGKFVGAILADPDKYEGKLFCAAILYSWEEIVAAISKATGETIVFKQVSSEEFEESLPGFQKMFTDAFRYQEEYGGFCGPESKKLIDWAAKNARGKLTTFEEFLKTHPVQLE
ncbi:hypothetical protein F4821DRAFT_233159 [Hypoxylon rubiginosum]|uniref:Uncharacterized protein n=1 Tax=Hypoxylon rubiginosum TaxID=110542 RepID=A0ACC0D7Z1_9PEZI|nr:hypothetical protein F4821DRAFT_233159 [Hypoxylon rubiginosum]